MDSKWNFIHKLSVTFLVIGFIALTFLFINESITESRFDNFLNEVRTEMMKDNVNNLDTEVEGSIDNYHNNAGIFPITISHFSVYLNADPESDSENIADYSWGEQYQEYKRASFYYPENDKGYIKVQSNTTQIQYVVTYIFFSMFILLATTYYIFSLFHNRKQFSYRLLLQRGLIALISSLILSGTLGLLSGAIGYMIIYIIYSLPVFLIVGIPASLLIDNWLKRINPSETIHYFIGLGLYALLGFIGGYFFVITFSFSNGYYVSFITDSLPFMNIGLAAAVIGYHVLLLFKKFFVKRPN